MQLSSINNVKIYNLSAGKSLPEFLSKKEKRRLIKNDLELERRIELIQDFEMPSVSCCIRVSADSNYVVATGMYKPRMRCYDLNELCMKFERGLDSEVVKFIFLEQDYSKILFLEEERYVELHSQYGRHYRWRIPRCGRDLAYHAPSCHAYFVGASSEIYRMNLETGQFHAPLETLASEILCCEFNPEHYLFACGTKGGTVECWDPRDRSRVAVLDITKNRLIDHLGPGVLPSVTSLKFHGGLCLGLGTGTGHVLLYDLRSSLPMLVKDHQYDVPIKSLAFHQHPAAGLDLVLSMDRKILKIWDRQTGKPLTAVQPDTSINDFCVVPQSGLVFMANEAPKILSYYLPDLGTVPKWCTFLDNVTEELEETEHQSVYQDYQFITRTDLDALGMSHLIGTNLLKAVMHGYYVDIRLYRKFKSLSEPYSLEQFRKDEIQKRIDEKTCNQFKIKSQTLKLPSVNKFLVSQILEDQEKVASGELSKKKYIKHGAKNNLLSDERFRAMFEEREMEIDYQHEDYSRLNPVVARQRQKQVLMAMFDEVPEDEQQLDEKKSSSREGSSSEEEILSSSDNEGTESRGQGKSLPAKPQQRFSRPRLFELKDGEDGEGGNSLDRNVMNRMKATLEERLKQQQVQTSRDSIGNKELHFTMKTGDETTKEKEIRHMRERRRVHRSASAITKTLNPKPKFWMGKRIQ